MESVENIFTAIFENISGMTMAYLNLSQGKGRKHASP